MPDRRERKEERNEDRNDRARRARNRRTVSRKAGREVEKQLEDTTHRETARDRVLENRRAEFARWYGGDSRALIGRRLPPTRTSLWSGPISALVAFPRSETACAPTQGGSWLEARGSHSVSQSLSRPAVRHEVGSVNERDASCFIYTRGASLPGLISRGTNAKRTHRPAGVHAFVFTLTEFLSREGIDAFAPPPVTSSRRFSRHISRPVHTNHHAMGLG